MSREGTQGDNDENSLLSVETNWEMGPGHHTRSWTLSNNFKAYSQPILQARLGSPKKLVGKSSPFIFGITGNNRIFRWCFQ